MKELHLILKRYRVVYIAVTAFFIWIGYDAWNWYKSNHGLMTEAAAAGFISVYLAIVGALKYILENSRQDQDHD